MRLHGGQASLTLQELRQCLGPPGSCLFYEDEEPLLEVQGPARFVLWASSAPQDGRVGSG